VLFITMVMFAPNGIMGLVQAHRPVARAGLLGQLALPYLRVMLPGLLMALGFVGLVELTSFLTIGAAQGKTLVLFGNSIDVHAPSPWLISMVLLLGGGCWFRVEARAFHLVWERLMGEVAPARALA
jgi:branched-chain amino acid transport system permease protein